MFNRQILMVIVLCLSCSTQENRNQVSADSNIVEDVASDMNIKNDTVKMKKPLRFATFNVSLFGDKSGALVTEFGDKDSQRGQTIAEILQRIRPDVVLLNEFDWDDTGEAARLFSENYLAVSQGGAEQINYGYRYVPNTNTGLASGVDFNNDGEAAAPENSQAYGDDSFGFGRFPGQYGMVVFSKYPISTNAIRSFQKLLWKDMTGNLLPINFYSPDTIDIFRLSSKNHVDVPINIDGKVVHFLISHPTPPNFDGDEDRNGKRNHDEIRFWLDYISGENAGYIVDDKGTAGPLGDASFFLAGDLNSDPVDAETRREALLSLLAHPKVNDTQPQSVGGPEAAENDGKANDNHKGDPKYDTADFPDRSVGNIRVDYALPSSDLLVVDSAVYWPKATEENRRLVKASDHRLVYVDLQF